MSQQDILNKLSRDKWYSSKEVSTLFPQLSCVSVSKNLKQMSKYGFIERRVRKKGRYLQSEFRGL